MIYKILPLDDFAKQQLPVNLGIAGIKNTQAGEAYLFDASLHELPMVFNGLYAGFEANIQSQTITSWDISKVKAL